MQHNYLLDAPAALFGNLTADMVFDVPADAPDPSATEPTRHEHQELVP